MALKIDIYKGRGGKNRTFREYIVTAISRRKDSEFYDVTVVDGSMNQEVLIYAEDGLNVFCPRWRELLKD